MKVQYTKTFAIAEVGAGSIGQIVEHNDADAAALIAAEVAIEYVEPVIDPNAPSPPPESIKSSGGPAPPDPPVSPPPPPVAGDTRRH